MKIFLDRPNPASDEWDVYCLSGRQEHPFIGVISKDGVFEFIEIPKGKPFTRNPHIRPLFRIDGQYAFYFFPMLVKALQDVGIIPQIQEVDANELKAVRNHLEDMRELVFKRRK